MKLIKRVFTACITITMCVMNLHCTHKKDKPATAAQHFAADNDSDIYVGIYLITGSIAY